MTSSKDIPHRQAKFIAIGGGMELSSNSPIIRKFVELAGGKDSVITILPVASDFGDEIGPMYTDAFRELSDDVEYYMIDERNDTENPDCLVRIKKSTGVFFTGGNQLRITALIGGSEFLNILNKKIQQGIVIAGTSAGASAMSSTMITWGRSERMTKGNLQMSPGLGFIPNLVLDSHFVKRGRISRLLNLVALNPGSLGIGLAEDTGILLSNNLENPIFEVLGKRQVIIVDGRDISHSNMAEVKEGRPYSISDVRIHVLGPGYKYNFKNHMIITPESEENNGETQIPDEVSELPFKPMSNDY